MESTPNQGWPYPDGSDPNNIGRDFGAFALAVDTTIGLQGPLDQRPAAGKRGRFYWATTWKDSSNGNAVTPWQVLYRDDGQNWSQVSPSAWQNWVPTIGPVDGSGAGTSAFVLHVSSMSAQYRALPGGEFDLRFRASIAVDGANPGFGGINMINLPSTATSFINPDFVCHFQNDLNRAWVQANFLSIYADSAHQWNYGNTTSPLTFRGTYSTS